MIVQFLWAYRTSAYHWPKFTLCPLSTFRHYWTQSLPPRLTFIMTVRIELLLTMYEGHLINKLQNCIILLIFKIWKIQNIRFVGNLIGHIYWNFYKDGAIIMTSHVHRTQSVNAVFCPFFYHLPSARHHCKLRLQEKWMCSAMIPV